MSRGSRALVAIIVLLFCTAPTPGDIGGCGQAPDILDAPTFFANKKRIDCERCEECGISNQSCRSSCDETTGFDTEFPEGCVPLVHDGEVCLRALQYASCDDYESYMADTGAETPSECNFCPPEKKQ